MEKRKFTYREAVLLLAIAAVAAAAYLFMQLKPKGSAAVLALDGKTVETVPLMQLSEARTYTINGTEITVSRDGARFASSPCPDKLCVKTGMVTRAGDSAVCLPQRVSVRLTGENGADRVTG